MTKQRTALWQTLVAEDDFLSAQELHRKLQDLEQRISLATTYRILQALADLGEVDVLRRKDGEAIYRQCEAQVHHHHLLCKSCGKTVEIEAPVVEKWAARTAAEHGFSEHAHTVEITGLCPQCQQEQRSNSEQ